MCSETDISKAKLIHKMSMSEKCHNNSDNHWTSRRTDGGKNDRKKAVQSKYFYFIPAGGG